MEMELNKFLPIIIRASNQNALERGDFSLSESQFNLNEDHWVWG